MLRRTILIIGIGLLGFFLFKTCIRPFWTTIHEDSLSIEEKEYKKSLIENEYRGLFNPENEGDLWLASKVLLKSQHPIAEFRYLYACDIFVTKYTLTSSAELQRLLILDSALAEKSTNVNYRGFESSNFEFSYSSDNDSLVQQLRISFSGELPEEIDRNDSLLILKTKSLSISVRQEPNGVVDLLFDQKNLANLPGAFFYTALKKINRQLYFILIIPRDNVKKVDEMMVLKLLS